MAKTNITEFSNVASNNTDINNVNIDENCPASNLNNALRELMKALKDVDTGSQALTALSVTGTLTANGGAVFNEASADVDFRVESNGNANMLFVDGGNDRIGISSSSPVAKLDVNSGDIAISSTQASDNGDLGEFQFWNLTNAGSGSGTSFVNDVASIQGQMEGTGNNSGGSLHFYTKTDGGAKTEQITITGAGNVGIGGAPTANLHVYRATGDASLIIETGEDSGAREPTLYLISYATNANPAIRFGDRVGNNGFIEYENNDDSLRFGTNASERMIIDSSGRLGIATSSARAKLTVAMDAASSDGIGLDNANGGATMDISLLGTSYNAHGAASGEVWLYSPDNINIGGATGNGNHIKFLANNTVRVLIHGSKPQVDYHGVKEYYYSGSLGNSTIVVNIDISGQSNSGVVLIQAAFNHYSINQYGAARTSNLGVYGGGIISTHDIQNISSGNGGSWTYSTPTSGTIRITKNAGTYAGGGYYWVKVTTYF